MSTRSRIGIQNADGTITSIYAHSDGYPAYTGRILHDHYQTIEKIHALMQLGNISTLGANPEPTDNYKQWRQKATTTPDHIAPQTYCATLSAEPATTTTSIKAFAGEQWAYLYTEHGWLVSRLTKDSTRINSPRTILEWQPLDEVLSKQSN